jgi:hypothetical protein
VAGHVINSWTVTFKGVRTADNVVALLLANVALHDNLIRDAVEPPKFDKPELEDDNEVVVLGGK